ncbi:ABC transporter ATP-binding protein [Mangrovitalea sediminis]|uniref:ABC transporter ATP-binding protein n=1 Tax=Mangrovitalea sediminis TaxID=1982043 RepID=UPI000BE578BE|nr:ABC transporter ATP-binding protein [Mangrovitalea sediminis]
MEVIVECRNLKKRYFQGSVPVDALRGVDLQVEKGDFVSLSGPSGSGKSTLLNVLGGLDNPSEGSVKIAGQDLSQLSKGDLADLRLQRIGFVFQAYNLIPVLSAEENVEFILQLQGVGAAERRQRARMLLAQVGLTGMESRRPAQLSGGQQQRVAVARALAAKPSVVLADEPTANLDSATAESLLSLMAELNQESGITFIVATHDPRVIAHTRRRIVLTDGQIDQDVRVSEDEMAPAV